MNAVVVSDEQFCDIEKAVGESVFLQFDFTLWLPPGVTITSAVCSCTSLADGSSHPEIISGAATVLPGGAIAQQMVTAGVSLTRYAVTAQATFSDTQSRALSAKMKV